MILVDTLIWIDHLRQANLALVELLEKSEVLTHSWVIGEPALGNLRNRDEILHLPGAMPVTPVVSDEQAPSARSSIERKQLPVWPVK